MVGGHPETFTIKLHPPSAVQAFPKVLDDPKVLVDPFHTSISKLDSIYSKTAIST